MPGSGRIAHVGEMERLAALARARKLRRYGITPADYARMLAEQGGVCAICRLPEVAILPSGSVKPLAVDHDHATGKVRGLLCNHCNTGISALDKNRDNIDRVLDYWRKGSGL